MRIVPGMVCAAFALSICNPANADSTVDYSVGSGRTTNIFKEPTPLRAAFNEAKLGLRASFVLEGSEVAYGVTVSGRRFPRYRFADDHRAGLEIGSVSEIGKAVTLTLKGGIEQRRDGDLFLALPGLTIGYRKADIAAAASAGITVEHGGGKSHATVALSNLNRGEAEFTLPGLPRLQLEAGNRLLDLTGGHIRPLLGGEVGATLQYRANHIPADERMEFERFPAQTLRGSLAYGRAFGSDVTLLAEAGLVRVAGDELGASVDPTRPFLKAELAWQLPADTLLRATLGRDIRLADIDDPIGEDVRTVRLSLEKALTEKLALALSCERASSDWLYYDYRTRTTSTTATLTYTLAKGAALALEYSHLRRRETDEAADFRVDGLAMRFSGAF